MRRAVVVGLLAAAFASSGCSAGSPSQATKSTVANTVVATVAPRPDSSLELRCVEEPNAAPICEQGSGVRVRSTQSGDACRVTSYGEDIGNGAWQAQGASTATTQTLLCLPTSGETCYLPGEAANTKGMWTLDSYAGEYFCQTAVRIGQECQKGGSLNPPDGSQDGIWKRIGDRAYCQPLG